MVALTVGANAQTRHRRPAASLNDIQRSKDILIARRTTLWRSGFPFRNVGVNIPDLFELFLLDKDTEAKKTLVHARYAGVRFVRCWGSPWTAEHFAAFETDRNRWFAAFDRMLAATDEEGIAIVPSLLANIRMIPAYVNLTAKNREDIPVFLSPGSASNRIAVEYVTAVVTRYRQDPRILFWEIGNEYNMEADRSAISTDNITGPFPTSDQVRSFLAQIAVVINKLDLKHLITSGNSDMRRNAWLLRQTAPAHLQAPRIPVEAIVPGDTFEQYIEMLRFFNPPPISVISVHQIPPGNNQPFWLMPHESRALVIPWTSRAAERIGQPLFVGSFGQAFTLDGKEQSAPWTKDFLLRFAIGTVQIGTLWNWESSGSDNTSSMTLGPDRTPEMVRTLGTTNQAILTDSIGTTQPDKERSDRAKPSKSDTEFFPVPF